MPPPVGFDDSLEALLTEYGLLSELEWALGRYAEGFTPDRIILEMRNRPAYQARFPAMKALSEKDRAISEAEYIGLERTYAQINRAAGLPSGFFDSPDDFSRLIGGEVSASEYAQRVNQGLVEAERGPAEVRDELTRLYGIDQGGLAAFFLDPDRALPVIEQQFTAARLSGAGRRTGFGALTQTEAERLGELGTTIPQAEQGFGELSSMREVFGALPGQEFAEDQITREEQFAAAFGGESRARERIQRRAAQRTASFQSGGGFASGQEGIAGLGEAAG